MGNALLDSSHSLHDECELLPSGERYRACKHQVNGCRLSFTQCPSLLFPEFVLYSCVFIPWFYLRLCLLFVIPLFIIAIICTLECFFLLFMLWHLRTFLFSTIGCSLLLLCFRVGGGWAATLCVDQDNWYSVKRSFPLFVCFCISCWCLNVLCPVQLHVATGSNTKFLQGTQSLCLQVKTFAYSQVFLWRLYLRKIKWITIHGFPSFKGGCSPCWSLWCCNCKVHCSQAQARTLKAQTSSMEACWYICYEATR